MNKNVNEFEFDACVLGGGMIGATIALGLARQGRHVAVVEQTQPRVFDPSDRPDIRLSAISLASVNLLKELNAWEQVKAMRVHPYRRLAVWEQPGSRTEFDAQDSGHPLLGYFVENRVLQLGVYEALKAFDNVHWFVGSTPKAMNVLEGTVTLDEGQSLKADVLIGADGGQSKSRTLAGIGTQGWQYAQHAMGILIKAPDADKSITWQQFTPAGPVAFLPMFEHYGCLIWYDEASAINSLKTQSDNQLHASILRRFPDLLGEFEVLDKAAFPLTRMHANHYGKGRLILAGDAIHTINPLAGQGVNLGFKDVASLLPLLDDYFDRGAELHGLINQYEKQRRPANLAMMSIMDGLYGVFSNDHAPLRHLRNVGLHLAQRSGPLKRKVMEFAMGLN